MPVPSPSASADTTTATATALTAWPGWAGLPLAAEPSAPLRARWQVRLLGGLALSDGRQQLHRLPSRAHVALLARLALAPQRAHAREELVELLWPGVALEVGRNRLRQVLSTLKSVLEPVADGAGRPVLLADRTSLRVAPGAFVCDVPLFEHAVRSGRHAAALQLYCGELLPGYYDAWIDDERARLAALRDRVPDEPDRPASPPDVPASPPEGRRPLLGQAAGGPAGPPLSPWPAQAPQPPGPGPSAAAGWPAPADPPPAVAASSPLPLLDMARRSLPQYLTPLFGVDQALAQLQALLRQHRLLSLLGPGGCGKTRLAVALAGSCLHAGGWTTVRFVPWVACARQDQALDALAAALELPAAAPDPLARVVRVLSDGPALLVLDNCEQLVPQAQPLVAELLAQLPQLHLVLTSRRPLGVDGEREFDLAPLPPPPEDADLATAAASPALALLLDRARAVRADFRLTERNRAALCGLVQVLDGMPLALELAATRLRSMSAAELLQRLSARDGVDSGSGDRGSAGGGAGGGRLALLQRNGPRASTDPRHASMQHVVAWSWQQLAPAEAALLARLTVLRGSFNASAATELMGPTPDDVALLLDSLVGHHLVRLAGEVDEVQRFALYEPVRDYAAGQLAADDAAATRGRLRAWALWWVRQQPPTPSLPALRAEVPNLVAALASAVLDQTPADAVHLLEALRPTLDDVPLPRDGLAVAVQALQACGDAGLRARGQAVLAPGLYMAGQAAEAVAMAEAALAATAAPPSAGTAATPATSATPAPAGAAPAWFADQARARARALHALARVRWRAHRRPEGVDPLLDEADALEAQAPCPDLRASLLALRAFVANTGHRDHGRGEALHRQALALWVQLGNQHAVASGRYNLAICATHRHAHGEALALLADVLRLAAEHQDLRRLSQALNVQGIAHAGRRDWPAAADSCRQCLRLARQTRNTFDLVYGLWNLAPVLAHQRQPEPAARLMAAAVGLWQRHFGALDAQDLRDITRVRRLVCRQWRAAGLADAEARWQAAQQAAAGLDVAQAYALAMG